MSETQNKYHLYIYLALVIVTLIAFEPIRHNEFVDFDDNTYITQNPNVKAGLTPQSIVWAFSSFDAANWHPLTWLSHMLDYQLFGLNPLGHHLTNLIFHIANTLLLFWIFKKTTSRSWPAAFVAAAFALHPLHVESVAWAAERKDVLSTFFFMATIAFYIRYAQRPNIKRYLLVFFALCLGLMAKPMLVTLPFVLLLLDYWPLQRFQWPDQHNSADTIYKGSSLRHLIAEKIPLFVLVIASSVITVIAQRIGGAMSVIENLSMISRMENALVSYIKYIVKMIYPNPLAVLYPHPADSLPFWQAIVCFLILAVVSTAVIYTARRRRYLTVGWLWYIGTLVPVIGLVQVGRQAIADRYTYIPLIGIFIIIAWGTAELTAKWKNRKAVLSISAALILTAMLLCTRNQLQYWRNSLALFRHTVQVTDNNYLMHKLLGNVYAKQLELEKSIYHWSEALELKSDWPDVCNNLAWLLITHKNPKLRNPEKALELAQRACKLTEYEEPDYMDTLAAAYARTGKYPQAIETAQKAISLAQKAGNAALTNQIQSRLRLYKARSQE